jgi:hypothetical protein
MAENQLLYPQDFNLESCKIVTALGQPFDFSKMVVEINYFEDIFNNVVTGNLFLNDSSSMLNTLGFSGNDYLILSFSKPGDETSKIEKVFRIFNVSNRAMTKDQNENYILNFCSEELVISEQYKISKSYPNQKVSDIARDIMFNKLKVRPEKFLDSNIETTKGVHNYIIPTLKPFEALNWLATRAISDSPKTKGSPYLFFENRNGYNFRSLQSLYTNPVYKTYRYEPKNLHMPDDQRVQDLNTELSNVLAYETISNYDIIDSINSGAFANRLIAIDPVRLTYTVNNFDLLNYFTPDTSKLNTFPPITNAVNRLGDTVNSTYDAVIKMATTNTGQIQNSYIKQKEPSVKPIDIETFVPFRTAQIALNNTIRYKLVVAGDPLLTVGTVIEFLFPEMRTAEDNSRIDDVYYSGNFLITAVRHKIDQENKFVSILEISKESLKVPYFNFDNTLPAWKDIRGR